MWISSVTGFYSVVQSADDPEMLVVRARVRDDLVRLKQHYLPQLSAIRSTPRNDYQFRAQAKKTDVAAAIGKAVLDLDYPNYKSAVATRLGIERAHILADVWRTLLRLAATPPQTE